MWWINIWIIIIITVTIMLYNDRIDNVKVEGTSTMEDLISGLVNTALDAASSLLHQHADPSHSSSDRSTWAEVVGGEEEDFGKSAQNDPAHNAHSWQNAPEHPHTGSNQQQYKHQGVEGEGEDYGKNAQFQSAHFWQNAHQDAPTSYQHQQFSYTDQVLNEQWQKFRKHSSKQEYAKPVESTIDTEPTQEEFRNLSAACNRLWELDLNRLTPGQDYEINCGEGKKVYDKEDMAENSLFRYVNTEVFHRATYARFYALLDNYSASERVEESVTDEKRQEELAFIEEISRTAPMQYLFKYLVSQGIVSQSSHEFKQHLHSLWFGLYGRGGSHGSSSAFEHIFVGEIKNDPEMEVSGFHNWIKFFVEEAAGRVDYQGYILPRRRGKKLPDAHSQFLSIQFLWNGSRKAISSTFVGVSPEFEVALYTLCFYQGQVDNYVDLGPYRANIKCYRLGKDKMGSAFPIADD